MSLSLSEQIELKEALYFMHISELKSQLKLLKFSAKAFNKQEIIDKLVHFAVTGKELPSPEIPPISKAQEGKFYPLAPQTHMLFGSYKNDLATRNFFKKLIGAHFHFTAQGIDWLRSRWLGGHPPTYYEFAKEWQNEYERNLKQKRPPKQEWAYIRFTQTYMKQFPESSRREVTNAWKKKRQEYIQKAYILLKKISK